jgi:signal transduction histidine kinase
MRMAQLLDALSDYNRVALGQGLPVSPAHCDLVAECAAELDLLRAHPHAPFTWTTSAPAVHGVYDASRVRQALANLVTNAIKYGRSGAPVVVTFEPLLNGARLAVENEGHPVSAEQRAKIFEPLYRGPACKGKDGGMGLGLFIAREVARAHGGDVECQPGADGMTFVVTLQSAALPGSADPHAAG